MGDRVIKSQWACNHELYRPSPCPLDIGVSFVGQPHGNRLEIIRELSELGFGPKVYGFGWTGAPRLPFHEMVRIFNRTRINLNLSNASMPNTPQQIKGRNFEIPGAGGFLMTSPADNLEEYYEDGKEIVVFRSTTELKERISYYLRHDSERSGIAQAGYERTIRDHTWDRRWNDILGRLREIR
jgi:spore maturation protein CgeB